MKRRFSSCWFPAGVVGWWTGLLANLHGWAPGPWWAWWSPLLALFVLAAWCRVVTSLDQRRERAAIRRAFKAGLLALTDPASPRGQPRQTSLNGRRVTGRRQP